MTATMNITTSQKTGAGLPTGRVMLPAHNFDHRYLTDADIPDGRGAVAPRNVEYLNWRTRYPNPKEDYAKLRPDEPPSIQCDLYENYLIKNREYDVQRQLCLQIARSFSPIVVPNAALLTLPPSLRKTALLDQPTYVRAEMKFKGEWLVLPGHKNRSKPWLQLEYTVRLHTNTRNIDGLPPSLVISRTYADSQTGRTVDERLLSPDTTIQALRGGPFAAGIHEDSSGNLWIREAVFQEASAKRYDKFSGNDARTILNASHHFFWKEKLW